MIDDIEGKLADPCWKVELTCDCPHCGELIDLLEATDFWDGAKFEVLEHGTPATRNVKCWCPDCGKPFLATFQH